MRIQRSVTKNMINIFKLFSIFTVLKYINNFVNKSVHKVTMSIIYHLYY